MGLLDDLGKAARNITSVARAGRQVGKLVDDVKDRASDGVGQAASVQRAQRNYKAFQVRVVQGLIDKGWEHDEVAELTGMSPLAVKRIAVIDVQLAKVVGPMKAAPEVEEDVAY